MTGITKQLLSLSLAYAHQSKGELKGKMLGEMLLLKQPSHPHTGAPKISTAFQAG